MSDNLIIELQNLGCYIIDDRLLGIEFNSIFSNCEYRIYINVEDKRFSDRGTIKNNTNNVIKSVTADEIFHEINSEAKDIYNSFSDKINSIADILIEYNR